MKKTTYIDDKITFEETKKKLLDGEAIEIEAEYVPVIRINFSNATGGMNLQSVKCKDKKLRRLYVPK